MKDLDKVMASGKQPRSRFDGAVPPTDSSHHLFKRTNAQLEREEWKKAGWKIVRPER